MAHCRGRLAALALAATTVTVMAAACGDDDGPPPADQPDATPTAPTAEVTARGETAGSTGDPDDPAIWVHPTEPARSTIIATDKSHGLYVYDLDGAMLQDLPDGDMNSVDLRAGVTVGARTITMVTAGNRTDDTVAFYEVDEATGTLLRLAPLAGLPVGFTIYGHCMGRGPAGELWLYADAKDGLLVQWALAIDDAGAITATEVRRFDVGDQVENCVVDDELGRLYVGEEDTGIWRYGAGPEAGAERVSVATTGAGALVADVEGLTLYVGPDGGGYLLASSQGDNAYAAFARDGSNAFVARFRIVAGVHDAASESDGIDVTSAALGPAYPRGLFVAHDTADDAFTGDFKLVAWDDIAVATTPRL